MNVFKEQLTDFVEDQEEPFEVKFLVSRCNQFVDYRTVHDILYRLENEGKIVRVGHNYLSTRVMMKRWLNPLTLNTKRKDGEISLPRELLYRIKTFIKERPKLGYIDVDELLETL